MNQLDVRVLGRAKSVCVPYLPEMMVCDYLCEILVPTVGLRMDIKRNSVLDSVRYITKDAVITLNFENRLRKLGDIIPPSSKLTVLPLCRDPKLLGNATRADIHASCSICLMPNTNYSTLCHHRFHDICLCQWRAETCPMCRSDFDKADCDALKLSIIEGIRSGRIVSAPVPILVDD